MTVASKKMVVVALVDFEIKVDLVFLQDWRSSLLAGQLHLAMISHTHV